MKRFADIKKGDSVYLIFINKANGFGENIYEYKVKNIHATYRDRFGEKGKMVNMAGTYTLENPRHRSRYLRNLELSFGPGSQFDTKMTERSKFMAFTTEDEASSFFSRWVDDRVNALNAEIKRLHKRDEKKCVRKYKGEDNA